MLSSFERILLHFYFCSHVFIYSSSLLRGGRCFRKHPRKIADDTNHLLPPAVWTGCDVIIVGQVSKWCLFSCLASAWARCSGCVSVNFLELCKELPFFFFWPSWNTINNCSQLLSLRDHLDDKSSGISSLFLCLTHTHTHTRALNLSCALSCISLLHSLFLSHLRYGIFKYS